MKPIIVLCVLLGLIALPAISHADPVQASAQSESAFALDLYGKLDSGSDNLFFSPFSIYSALLMTYGGARGDTAAQMAQTLHLPPGQPDAGDWLNAISATSTDDCQLHVANALWGMQGVPWVPAFLDQAKNHYHAGLQNVDFNHPDAARKTINDWVADQTKDRIKDLLPEGSVGPSTRLVLTNAVYFKAGWFHTFHAHATDSQDFHVDAKTAVKTSMMHQTESFDYMETDQFQALDMGYRGSDWSMIVLLPKDPGGLQKLESSLDPKTLASVIDGLKDQRVDVSLPKFKMTLQLDLSEVMKTMGMKLAFDPNAADFSGMDDQRDLFVSDIIHKAFISVDEKGTEAAAATAVAVGAMAMEQGQPVSFTADHPFLLLIQDRDTHTILFMGRVNNPAE